MRISHKYKLVFISTPKSGSLSGFGFMEENFGGVSYGSYHNSTVPSECKNYKIFTFVRNPYERFVSLYNATVILGAEGKNTTQRSTLLNLIGKESLDNFGKYLAKKSTYPYNQLYPQVHLLNKSNVSLNKIKLIHIENATEEFNNWFNSDKIYKVPHARKREHPKWKDVKTLELTNCVNSWAEKDFELLGYEKE